MLGGLLGAKTMLGILKAAIEKQIKKKIEWYEMEYNDSEKKLYFIIPKDGDKKKIEYDDSKSIVDALKTLAAEKLEENTTIDFLIIRFHIAEDCTAKIYYTSPDGEKKFITEKL